MRIGLDNTSSFLSSSRPPRVFIGCSMTADGERRLRDELLSACEQVLQENGLSVYNPDRHTTLGSPHQVHEVYAIDRLNAALCDLILFLRVHPSLGMGIEAQIASDVLIPWFDARPADGSFRLTPLVAGMANPRAGGAIGRIHFSDVSDFREKLQSALSNGAIQERAESVRRARDAAAAVIAQARIGPRIRRQRLLLDMPIERLADHVDMQPWWIDSLERDDRLMSGVTLIQLMRLTESVRLKFVSRRTATGELAFPALETIDSIPEEIVRAADEFVAYETRPRLIGEPLPDCDGAMRQNWHRWATEVKRLSLPELRTEGFAPVDHLVGSISAPVSHLEPSERSESECIQQIINDVTSASASPSITVNKPGFNPDRHEHCPEIYLGTLQRLINSDFGILVGTPAATGVGITAQLFANASMPCLSIITEGAPLSRMFRGVFSRRIGEVIEYPQTDDLAALLADVLTENIHALRDSAARRRPIRERIAESSVSATLERFGIPRRMGMSESVRAFRTVPFLREEWLENLATDPTAQCTVTLMQFVHVAIQMQWNLDVSETGVPAFHAPGYTEEQINVLASRSQEFTEEMRRAADESMTQLLAAKADVNREDEGRLFSLDDEHVFAAWESYYRELTSTVFRDESEDVPVRSRKEWVRQLNDLKRS